MRRFLVINSNWHPISYRVGVIAAYCSNFGHYIFEPPHGGLETTYNVHLGLIGKCVVDFLLVLMKLFSLGVTAEALRANICSKSAISLQRGPVDPKFQVEGAVLLYLVLVLVLACKVLVLVLVLES